MTDKPQLFSELKRRRVFRTAAAYLAGAFVVLQVADLTFEPLGFPASAYRILIVIAAIGFPVALLLSWFFDIKRSESRPRLHMRAAWGLGAFVLVCAAFMAYGVIRHWDRADYDSSDVIAVLPFKVLGGTELAYLESGVVEMVSRNIDGAAGLRAVAPDMVLTYAKQKSATDPNEALAAKMSARYLVSGSVTQSGRQVRVTATLHDFKETTGTPLIIEGTTDELFAIVDRLSAQILGATRKGQDARLSQTAAVTTSSLPALRKYLQGEEHYRRTQYDSAIASFSDAVVVDSTFALAYYRLALSQIANGVFGAARQTIDGGLRHVGRLPERDQTLMRALSDVFNGRFEKAEQQYRDLLEQYPKDMEATFLLAELLFNYNLFRGRAEAEAGPLIDQVASADPEFLCPI